MIKSTTTIYFILLANIMLLAEVVVPHHHDKCAVFVVNTHYPLSDKVTKHSIAGQNHKTGCKKECKFIATDQVIVSPSNPLKLEYRGVVCPGSHQCFNGFQATLYSVQSYAFGSRLLTHAYPPTLIKSSYSQLVNTISGLRAPPIV